MKVAKSWAGEVIEGLRFNCNTCNLDSLLTLGTYCILSSKLILVWTESFKRLNLLKPAQRTKEILLLK